ncbi:MAG: ECF transporter S component [Clostridia bacterium]|nr:ECF transporter S component [Clostridia bacterium]
MSETNKLQSMNKRSKIKKIALYGILSAIIIIMSFTPLGFLKVGTFSITFLPIPVAAGAALLGPVGGLYLGSLFGLMSFIQCFGLDPQGVILLELNPIFTFILCVVTRALMGLCCGLIFKFLSKIDRTKVVSFIVSSFSAAFLNTVFFLFTFTVLFGDGEITERFGASISTILLTVVSVNGIIEVIVCTAVGFAISKALSYFLFKERSR